MTMNRAQGQPQDAAAEKYAGASSPNRVGFQFLQLDPSTNIYVQRDDQLVIQAMSSTPGEILNIGVRTLIPGRDAGPTQPDAMSKANHLGDSQFGTVAPIVRTMPMSGANVVFTSTIQMAEGFLLSIALSCTSATTRGVTFVKAFLVRGGTTVTNAAYMLCADYVTNNAPIGFPFGRVVSPLEGPGNLRVYTAAATTAGQEFLFDPAPNSRVRIAAVEMPFVASATVATRNIAFMIRDEIAGRAAGLFPVNVGVTASQTVQLTAAPGIIVSALIPLDLFAVLPQPPMMAFNGTVHQTLRTTTQNLQAADQFGAMALHVEEWLDF